MDLAVDPRHHRGHKGSSSGGDHSPDTPASPSRHLHIPRPHLHLFHSRNSSNNNEKHPEADEKSKHDVYQQQSNNDHLDQQFQQLQLPQASPTQVQSAQLSRPSIPSEQLPQPQENSLENYSHVSSQTSLISASLTPSGMTVMTPSSDEWKDRGAASIVKQEADENGQVQTKVIKKGVKDFNFGRTLGEGSYSTVVAATDRQTLREYAIKVLDKRHIIKEKKVKYVNIEKNTLNRLGDHPGIIRLYYTFQDERSLYFVLDFASNGELLSLIKKVCDRFDALQLSRINSDGLFGRRMH